MGDRMQEMKGNIKEGVGEGNVFGASVHILHGMAFDAQVSIGFCQRV